MNIPPTEEQVQQVDKMAEVMRGMFAHAPIEFNYSEEREDNYVMHMWGAVHHTIPARSLVVRFGLPHHDDECECVEPPPIMLALGVFDLDTDLRVPESGTVEILDPQGQEFIAGVCVMAVTCFNITGNL